MKSNNQYIVTDELLTSYLAGEANEAETARVQQWVSSSEENKKHLEHLKLLWETSGKLNEEIAVDVEKAWQKVKKRIEQDEQTDTAKVRKLIPFSGANLNYFSRIAAVFILLAGTVYFVFKYQNNSTKQVAQMVLSTQDNTLSDTLSDGTTVFLNKHSELIYTSDFGSTHRNVFLKGEAYFDVNHEGAGAFTVHTRDVIVRDIGTAFNVKAYTKEDIEVVVEKGSVIMKTQIDSTLLAQGNKAVYNKKRNMIIRSVNEDINTMAYRTKNIIFESTALSKVVELLNELYNTDIVVKSEPLNNCRLTAIFKNESIDTILNVLEETFQLKVNRTEKTIELEGAGCQ